jgi:hypothetical protein
MPHEAFDITFAPGALAVNLLAKVANDTASPHQRQAQIALAAWRECLATPEQLAMVDTNDEREVDYAGSCVSKSDGGFFIQTWTWVNCDKIDPTRAP